MSNVRTMPSRDKILEAVQKYFSIGELVDDRTKKAYGERAWRFFDDKLLWAIVIVREGLDKKMYINRVSLQQRGLRVNVCQIVKDKTLANKLYLSAHTRGCAVDFDIEGMTAEEVRDWIEDNANLFPFKIRLEDGVSWVHLDTDYEEKNPKVYRFDP